MKELATARAPPCKQQVRTNLLKRGRIRTRGDFDKRFSAERGPDGPNVSEKEENYKPTLRVTGHVSDSEPSDLRPVFSSHTTYTVRRER